MLDGDDIKDRYDLKKPEQMETHELYHEAGRFLERLDDIEEELTKRRELCNSEQEGDVS